MPPTLITSDKAEIRAFRDEHQDIILKPLFGNGGAGVFHVDPEDDNPNALLEMFTQLYREPIVVQRYLPEIRDGDKRIILIDGRAVGAVKRVPKAERRAPTCMSALVRKKPPCQRAIARSRGDRPGAEQTRVVVRRHRRDRRLPHRDQRHLTHRHSGNRPLRQCFAGGATLGCFRGALAV